MMKKYLILIFCLLSFGTYAQEYYQVVTYRAAPGKLLELIDVLKEDMKNYQEYGIGTPFLMRHSQGDHWDLLMMFSVGERLDTYFSETEIAKRQASKSLSQPYNSEFFDLISFKEEQIVTGPTKSEFERRFKRFNYYHVEIFHALAGKRNELLEQRQMENVYLKEIGRGDNLIFTKVFGGEADCFTLGFYRDIKHFAESADIPIEKEDAAAKKAGFESVYTIGSYLRSLLLKHYDTLAGAVRLN